MNELLLIKDGQAPPPFDIGLHLKCPAPTVEEKVSIIQLREALNGFELYENHKDWVDDHILQRFLIARKYNLNQSTELLKRALKWREMRQPSQIEQSEHWPDLISKEGETGKIRCPGQDKWGRSVIVMDNGVQNSKNAEHQMIFLAWNLEFAIKQMDPVVDK